jgi:hypothetical protein
MPFRPGRFFHRNFFFFFILHMLKKSGILQQLTYMWEGGEGQDNWEIVQNAIKMENGFSPPIANLFFSLRDGIPGPVPIALMHMYGNSSKSLFDFLLYNSRQSNKIRKEGKKFISTATRNLRIVDLSRRAAQLVQNHCCHVGTKNLFSKKWAAFIIPQ